MRESRQFVAELVVEQRELRHHHREHEDQERADQREQHAGIDERADELFAQGERDLLEAYVAIQHFGQVAGALAGQQRGGVHERKTALRFEGGGKRLAGFDARGNVFQLAGEGGIFLDFAEHLQRAEDGQAGANEGEELRIEDEEGLELDLAAAAADGAAGADRKDVIARVGEAGLQLVGRGRGLHLLLYAAAFIGQLDDELCHGRSRRFRASAAGKLLKSCSCLRLTVLTQKNRRSERGQALVRACILISFCAFEAKGFG